MSKVSYTQTQWVFALYFLVLLKHNPISTRSSVKGRWAMVTVTIWYKINSYYLKLKVSLSWKINLFRPLVTLTFFIELYSLTLIVLTVCIWPWPYLLYISIWPCPYTDCLYLILTLTVLIACWYLTILTVCAHLTLTILTVCWYLTLFMLIIC